jgi:integrase/recombinase XerD
MLKDFVRTDKRLQDNPLMAHLQTFATSLSGDGYAVVTAKTKLWLLADFGQWLGRRGLSLTNIDERLVETFVKGKQRVRRGDLRTLKQFLHHLRKDHIVPDRKLVSDRSSLADILSRYEKHLRSERGLVTATIISYQPFVRKFLVECFRERPFSLKKLKASDVSDFVLQHCRSMSVRRAQLMTTAFRSFFRFLFQNGQLQVDLASSVPTVADWRLSTVPKYLTPEEVKRVLKACNRRTSTGRRDYAVLLLLARLGLRAGEVVALQLDDIDWRAGEIIIRGKGLFHDRMPLPPDVGEALTSYLRRDRPTCQTRRVFVCRSPHDHVVSPRNQPAEPPAVSFCISWSSGHSHSTLVYLTITQERRHHSRKATNITCSPFSSCGPCWSDLLDGPQ